mmetsp:Transcript_324/g.1173  ORF Transcript_324/g.1173 Transcript_324/m.1173 type:complete len:108 (+) Transcript_324:186-509(+)
MWSSYDPHKFSKAANLNTAHRQVLEHRHTALSVPHGALNATPQMALQNERTSLLHSDPYHKGMVRGDSMFDSLGNLIISYEKEPHKTHFQGMVCRRHAQWEAHEFCG